jgi:prepilin-type N-terminal cleavage/methylation domain-containing protein
MATTFIKRKNSGFSLIELLIVVVIIGIIAAFTVPSLIGSKRGVDEKLAIVQLSDIKRAQTQYKDDLNVGKYGTLRELKSAKPGGNSLLDSNIVDDQGDPIAYKVWILEEIQKPTESGFGLKLRPLEGNPADYSFFMYEDGVVRRTGFKGPYTRNSGTVVQ